MVSHQALVAHTLSATKHYEISSDDKVLQFASLSFDVAAEEMFPALLCGASVVLLPERTPAISEFVNYLTKDGITVANLPSAYWHQWVDELDRLANPLPAPLRLLIVGNEKVSLDRFKRWHGHVGSKVRWLNAYGPTEAIVTATLYEAPQGEDDYSDLTSVPIGRPLSNRQIYILDRSLQPVPIGVPGELHIGGVGLARGYLDRPELTKEKFIANPFSADPTSRLYKTGDLARYLPDGNIEFLGRIDDQVKIRGFRIELGEIESVLGQYGAIRQAVVLAREDHPGDKRLVAYAVASPGSNPSASELRSYLQQKLPEYMIPSAYLVLDELPLTPNGKVDRKALPAPDQTRPELNEAFTAPRTATEAVLAGIWSEVLKVDKVGIHDNFFDLGGHSLLAVRVANLIKKRIGRTVRVSSIFQAPTVERMTSVLHDDEVTTPWSSLVPLQTKGFKPPFFWVHGELSDAYLPRYLDSGQPLYGLQHQGTDGQRAVYSTVEDIAHHYLKEIITVQPHGPYRLGGNCFGGLVAFEMAKQLQKLEQKVDLLALLNPASRKMGNSKDLSSPIGSVGNDLRHFLTVIPSLRSDNHWDNLPSRVIGRMTGHLLNLAGSAKRATQIIICKMCERFAVPIPVSLRSLYILEIYRQAIQDYVPRPFQGNMVLFFGEDVPRHRQVHWCKQSTGSVAIHYVPGDHTTVLQEMNVKVWAGHLATCLEALELEQSSVKRAVG
jgi:aspartate racemase